MLVKFWRLLFHIIHTIYILLVLGLQVAFNV